MNNFMISLQKFFKNKNTVTIIGVVAIILILFFGYRYQINKQVSPVTGIPVAATTIQPRTKITDDMLEYIDVAPIVLQKGEVITNKNAIVGKYSNYNTVIPKGSMFYNATVINEEELPDSAFIEVEDGQVPYNFPVTMDTTYGNSIFPGNYVDIYMKAVRKDGKLMVGKLLENVKVLAVKDSAGRHVFENSQEARTPAFLIFGVSPEVNILLRKASYMSSYSTVLFPVPHGATIEEEGATAVTSQTLKDFINANTVANDEIEDKKQTTETTTTVTE
ncbi:MAG: hypothetical protein E7157_01110 [Lactobacillales bacterium]|nr:hypothetical protein [Lactobacillales bacterium]